MEYEIGDDPQGLPELPECDRDGGVREPLSFRKEPKSRPRERAPVEQMGELV